MKVYGILEGVIDNTMRICNPAIRDFHVCETGFTTEQEAVQSLINTGWKNPLEAVFAYFSIGDAAWLHDEDGETDEDGQPITHVRYIFEMEVEE